MFADSAAVFTTVFMSVLLDNCLTALWVTDEFIEVTYASSGDKMYFSVNEASRRFIGE
ncbi:MAG: hypothetical protein KGL39_27660 [Patescibacteria group bacterium]|nr:hypothetical protein [Patescibacteria group bacterium]